MSQTETVEVAVSATEVKSLSEIVSIITQEIETFARKYGVEDQFDRKSFEEDLAIFLVKRKIVGLRELRVSVLEGGDIRVGDVIRGKRRADLIIRLHYKGVRRK